MTTRRSTSWPLTLAPWLLSCSDAPLSSPPPTALATQTAPLVAMQQAKLVADDNQDKADQLGWSVALSRDGRTALAGGPYASGVAYVFASDGATWQQQARLTPSDLLSKGFGYSVALSDDGQIALVGAPHSGSGSPYGGVAHLFSRQGQGWAQQQKILPEEEMFTYGYFGKSVAMSSDGSILAVTAQRFLSNLTDLHGAAYVFVRTGNTWNQQARLLAEDQWNYGDLSQSMAMSSDGSTLLIGARGSSDAGTANNGAVYVFTRVGDSWSQQAKLLASDKEDGGNFGISVALSADGQTALIGSWLKDDGATADSGAAYVFARTGDVWNEQAKLLSSAPEAEAHFGFDVALSSDGQTALISADVEDDGAKDNGVAYVFVRVGSAWSQRQRIVNSDQTLYKFFGHDVSLSGDGSTGLLGAPRNSSNGKDWNGAAYVFTFVREEGEACTTSAQCSSGFCADGVCCTTACDAGPCDACAIAAGAPTDGTCVLLTGTTCDDGNGCTQTDTCQAGVCVSGGAQPDGAPCSDGSACTTSDTCQAGLCQSGTAVVCTPGECQQATGCEPVSGACVFSLQPDGTPCATGLCWNGSCQGAAGAGGASGQAGAGQAGAGGEAGQGGTAAGSSGTSGYPDVAGNAGEAGAAGSSGASGYGGDIESSGHGGLGGSSGPGGSTPSAGNAGQTGAAGPGGSPGLGGGAGQGGAGQAGQAGASTSGASGQNTSTAPPVSDLAGGGCSCRTTGRTGATGVWPLEVLAIGLAGRRRRRGRGGVPAALP